MAQWVKNLPSVQETQEMWVPTLGWKIPWRRKWQPTPVFFIGKSHKRGAWWAIVQKIAKSRTWLTTGTHTHSVSSFIWVVGRIQFFTVVRLRSISLLAIFEGCIQLWETTYIPRLERGWGASTSFRASSDGSPLRSHFSPTVDRKVLHF